MRSWLFQTNPRKYNISEALRQVQEHGNRMAWLTQERRAADVHIGDRVCLWASLPIRALLGAAEVETEPAYADEPEWERRLWRPGCSRQKRSMQVSLKLTQVLKKPIPHSSITTIPAITGNRFFQKRPFTQGTNFLLTRDEAAALDSLING